MNVPFDPSQAPLPAAARSSLRATVESSVAVGPIPRRVDVLGIHVSVTNPDHAVARIGEWIAGGGRECVCVSDVNALLQAREEPSLRAFYNGAGMVLPDGMPLVWAARSAGFPGIERVSGPDLLPRVLQESLVTGWRHYFLGGAEGVAQRLTDRMCERFPGVKIVGVECPPFRELTAAEKAEQVARVNKAQSDIVWIGLGAPKQERWMAEYRPLLEAPVLIGVGAAFNFHSGDVKRAPMVLQRAGLEWVYRLSQEPKRLWRRYAVGIPKFLGGVAVHRPRAVE